jgi:hypothetical protein
MGDRLPPRWTHPTTYAHGCSPRSRRISLARSRRAWRASIPPRRRRRTRPSRSRPRAGTSPGSSRRRERGRPSPMTWTRTAASSRRGARARPTMRGPKSPSPSGPCASRRRWGSACTCRPARRGTGRRARRARRRGLVRRLRQGRGRDRSRGQEAERVEARRAWARHVEVPLDEATLQKGIGSPARVGCASRASCAPPRWKASSPARACSASSS